MLTLDHSFTLLSKRCLDKFDLVLKLLSIGVQCDSSRSLPDDRIIVIYFPRRHWHTILYFSYKLTNIKLQTNTSYYYKNLTCQTIIELLSVLATSYISIFFYGYYELTCIFISNPSCSRSLSFHNDVSITTQENLLYLQYGLNKRKLNSIVYHHCCLFEP